MKLGIAAGQENGIGIRLWRFVFQGREEGDFRPRLFPGLQDVGVGETEGHVVGDRYFLAERGQDRAGK